MNQGAVKTTPSSRLPEVHSPVGSFLGLGPSLGDPCIGGGHRPCSLDGFRADRLVATAQLTNLSFAGRLVLRFRLALKSCTCNSCPSGLTLRFLCFG